MSSFDSRNRISLDGDWELTYFKEGTQDLAGPAGLEQSAGLPCVTARVPGNVELDLQRAGVISEPFYAANVRDLRPYEFYEWWHTRRVDVPASAAGARWDLVFAGLDTLATVWVNGVEVGRRGQHADRAPLRRDRRPSSPARRTASPCAWPRPCSPAARLHYEARHAELGAARRGPLHPQGRRTCGAGTSCHAPSRPASGAPCGWRHGRTTDIERALLLDGLAGRRAAPRSALHFQFRTPSATWTASRCSFQRPRAASHTFEFEWPVEFVAEQLPHPGARRPPLVAERLRRAEPLHRHRPPLPRRAGAGRAHRPHRHPPHRGGPHGARRRRLVDPPASRTSPRAPGHAARAGQPLPVPRQRRAGAWSSGANWVPLDAFHSRDAERLEQAVALFDDLGCNMIRCWGGNVYEDHPFFDLCDEHGILVWQDFAFACCLYPQTEEFLAQVRIEAAAVASRLRNHASLAIWCGDNEIDMVHTPASASRPRATASRARSSRRCCTAATRTAHYVPSSPYVPPSVEGRARGVAAHARAAPVGAARLLQGALLHRAQRPLHRRDRLPRLPERLLDQALHLARARSGPGRTTTSGRCTPSTTGAIDGHRPRPHRS